MTGRTPTCGAVRPGNYANWVPLCDRPADHEGKHEGPSAAGSAGTRYWWTDSQHGLSAPASSPTREA